MPSAIALWGAYAARQTGWSSEVPRSAKNRPLSAGEPDGRLPVRLWRLLLRRLSTTLIAAALLGFAACGEDRDGDVESKGGTGTTGTSTTATTPAGAAVATVKVRETDYALSPKNPKVAKAGVVKFEVTNAGKVPHALEVEGPGEEVETKTIAPGEKATLKADLSKRGTYEWYCPIDGHKGKGMEGKIAVAGGGSSGSGGDESERDEGSTEKDESKDPY